MTTRLCTHAALTPGTEPSLDGVTGELRIPITLYRIDEPILRVDLVVSASEMGISAQCVSCPALVAEVDLPAPSAPGDSHG
ncbi:hypothetical protein [Streptomyces sp. SID3343]|uniref:hypothetical protein n=1 Tax=Streptomyces sp. SID3343 TaxID=2690260 RepID=UPI0013685C10|nr:hypothetical protein [Streptomyces sp. SID3343]MYW00820.1 hypothetical protein [Streptomyces sp. SID3343]